MTGRGARRQHARGAAHPAASWPASRQRLAAQLDDDAVGRASRETLAAGGKRLRPLLVLICRAAGRARPAPSSRSRRPRVELVHMATLVHDDVLDAAPLRRGHATVWARHGEALARATRRPPVRARVRRADASGLARCGRRARRWRRSTWRAARRCRASRRAAPRSPSRPTSSAAASRPAGCSAPPARSAACSAASTAPGVDALERFGEQLGIAFQLADDVLDCDGDPESTGKALGIDLLDGTVDAAAAPGGPARRARRRRAARPGPRPGRRAWACSPAWRASGAIAEHAPSHRAPNTPTRRARPRRAARPQRPPAHSRLSCRQRRPATTEDRWQARLRAHADRPRPREGPGGRATRLRRRRRAARERRPARARRARRSGAAAARRRRRGLLRQQPLPEPHERLPREVQVLRVRAHERSRTAPTSGRSGR